MVTKHAPMDPLHQVLNRLPGASRIGNEWVARCPAHVDATPSLSLGEGADGTVLIHCFGGCSALEVVTALGLTMRELFPRDVPRDGGAHHGVGTEYHYEDEGGTILFRVVRGSGRDGVPRFYQQASDGRGGWRKGKGAMDGVRRVLYRLPALRAAEASETVFLCEGEKDADNLARLGVVTTTNPGGAGKWEACERHGAGQFSEPLRDRTVVVLPDNDEAGRKHARDVARRLEAVAVSVRVVELPGLPPKGDVSDWLHAGGTVEQLSQLVDLPGDVGCTAPSSRELGDDAGSDDGKCGSQAKRLVAAALATSTYLFHDEKGESYAAISESDRRRIVAVGSSEFGLWLRHLAWAGLTIAPGSETISSAREVLRSMARFDSPQHCLHVRLAWHDGSIWIDLDGSNAVRVNPGSWQVLTDPPILFRRFLHQRPLPMPTQGGDIRDVLRFLRIRDRHTEVLYLGYLVAALVPGVPVAALVIHGPQGATKSTTLKVTKRLLDPSQAEVRGGVQSQAEFAQAASQNRVLYFDNLSAIPSWLSDALCGAVTGDGWAKRTLFTDEDTTVFEYQGVVGLAGINLIADRPDLLDRSLIVHLDPVPPEERREERAFWTAFDAARPAIFGGMLDQLARAMDIEPRLADLGPLPRMADFARWGTAATISMGFGPGAFLDAYGENGGRQNQAAVDASPVAGAVLSLMDQQEQWSGSPSELLAALQAAAESAGIDIRDRAWPKSPVWATRRLREVEASLLTLGVRVEEERTGRGRRLALRRTMSSGDGKAPRPVDTVTDIVTGNSVSCNGPVSSDSNDSISGRVGEADLSVNDPNDPEAFEERAAILEFDAGLPRERAEQVAREIIAASSVALPKVPSLPTLPSS